MFLVLLIHTYCCILQTDRRVAVDSWVSGAWFTPRESVSCCWGQEKTLRRRTPVIPASPSFSSCCCRW